MGLELATFIVLSLPPHHSSYQELHKNLENLLKSAGKSSAEVPASSDGHSTSDSCDDEGPAREEHNGEYAGSDKTKTGRRRPCSTNNPGIDECADTQLSQADATNNQPLKQNIMADESGESVSAPIWTPKTPPNAFHITSFTPSPPKPDQRAAVEFRTIEIQQSGDFDYPEIVSPPTVVRISEKDDVEQNYSVADPSASWGNGLYDDYGSPVQRARPSGRNYFPVFKDAKRTYEKFHPVSSFDPFKDRSSLSTPSAASEDEDDAGSPSPLPRYGNANANSSEILLDNRDNQSNTEKFPLYENPFASPETPQADGIQSQLQETSRGSGEQIHGRLNSEWASLYKNTAYQQTNQRIWSGTTNSGLELPEFPPQDGSTSSSSQQWKGAADVGNWLTQPLPVENDRSSKRLGSGLEIDSDYLRPRRKYRLYERPQDRSPENDQSKQVTASSVATQEWKGIQDPGDLLTKPLISSEKNSPRKRPDSEFEINHDLVRPRRKYRLYERPQDRSPEKDPSTQGKASTFDTQLSTHSLHQLNAGNMSSATFSRLDKPFQKAESGGFNATANNQVPFNQTQSSAAQYGAGSLGPFLEESLQRLDATQGQSRNFPTSRRILSDIGRHTRGARPTLSTRPPSQFPALDSDKKPSVLRPASQQPISARAGDVSLHHPKPQRGLQPLLDRLEDTASESEKSGVNPWYHHRTNYQD